MATPLDLDLRLPPDALCLSPDIGLNLGGGALAPSGESLPLTMPPEALWALDPPADQPAWAWPAAMAAAAALHSAIALLLVTAWTPSPLAAPPELIDVTVVSEMDVTPGQAPAAAASKNESNPAEAAPSSAAPSPAVAEARPQLNPANPSDEETPPLPPVPSPAPEPTQPAVLTPERPVAEDQGTTAPSGQALPTSLQPPQSEPPKVAPAGPEPRSSEMASLSAPAAQPADPTVSAATPAEAVPAVPASEAPSPPLRAPAVAAEQSPRAAVKPEAAATRQPKGTTGPAHVKPSPRPAVATPQKPVERPLKPTPSASAEAHDPAPARENAPGLARQTAGLGAAAGSSGSSQAARASYGALLLAEIARHKVYPDAARALGETGSVAVALTVGPAGRIVSHSITRSSGNAAIDREVDAMLAAVQAPPPPDGVFRTGVTIRFNLQ